MVEEQKHRKPLEYAREQAGSEKKARERKAGNAEVK